MNDAWNPNQLAEYLKEHEKIFNFTEKIAHIGSLEWYIKTDNMIWSDELYRILGFEPGSFKPTLQNFIDRIYSHDKKRVLDAIQKILDKDAICNLEFRIEQADNMVRYVHVKGAVYRDHQRKPLKINCSVQDITERKQIEEKLRVQNEELLKYTAVIDGMDDIVIITDHSGFITYVNQVCEKVLGYSSEKIKGRHISDCKSIDSHFALRKEDFIEDPKSIWTGKLYLRTKHGLNIQTSLKSSPIMKDGHIISRAFVLRIQY